MTCVIGFTDKKKKITWLGGDSCAAGGGVEYIQKNNKVFRNCVFPKVIMGGTTSFRHLDLLEFSESLFEEIDFLKDEVVDRKFMVTKFVPNIIKLFKEGIMHTEEKDKGGNFLVGVPGGLFEIQGDFSVLEPDWNFAAVGCGYQTAMGSLLTTMNNNKMQPHEKILAALQASEKYNYGVRGPFKIICTDKNWGDDGEAMFDRDGKYIS